MEERATENRWFKGKKLFQVEFILKGFKVRWLSTCRKLPSKQWILSLPSNKHREASKAAISLLLYFLLRSFCAQAYFLYRLLPFHGVQTWKKIKEKKGGGPHEQH